MAIAENLTGRIDSTAIVKARSDSFLNQRPQVGYTVDRQPLGEDPARAYEPNLPVFVPKEGPPIDFLAAANRVVQKATTEGRVARFLDIGCGEGVSLRWLKERFGQAVEAVGISSIDFRNPTQREQDKKQGIIYLIYDAQALSDFDQGPFDLIVSVNAISHMADPLAVLKGAYNILRPGGFAFLHNEYLDVLFVYLDDYLKFASSLERNFGVQARDLGLAFQRTKPDELSLPSVQYVDLVYNSNGVPAVRYSFDEKVVNDL